MYRLLIVDDESHIIDGVRRMIDWSEYNVTEIRAAHSFQEAVTISFTFRPHIVLTDVKIGEDWGYDLIEALSRANLDIHYVMMSGYDDFDLVRKSLLAGAKDYLLKPIDKDKLREIITKIITIDLQGELPKPKRREEIDPVLGVPLSSLSKLTNKVLLIVKSAYSENISLRYVADLFQMNSVYIGQAFLRETHMKFSEYLLVYRMHIAYDLIKNTDEKVSYIARRVGYQHLNYFYSLFHNYYDISPSELRSSLLVEEEQEMPV